MSIIQKRGKMSIAIPHKLFIDGRFVGIMKDSRVTLEIPMGQYCITIQSMIPYFSASHTVDVLPHSNLVLTFSDREKWWDALFMLDIILWIAKRFLYLAAPWTWVYEIFTNGYFILWIAYEWRIRDRYFKFDTQTINNSL